MTKLDLSSHLLDIYTHSEQIADWENRQHETEEHLQSIEEWLKRYRNSAEPVPPALAYMMLIHLNMLKGYVYISQTSYDKTGYFHRLFRVKARLVESLTCQGLPVESTEA